MALIPFLERAVRLSLMARGVESRRIDTPHAVIHLYDAPGRGELPPVVCMHGLGSSAAAYATLVRKLRSGARRVLAPEMPAHGLSGGPTGPFNLELIYASWRDVFLQELDEPAFLVGNSLGGGIAVRFALEHPDRVRGIILTSPAGARIPDDEFAALLGTFKLETRRDARAFLERLYHRPPWFGPFLAPDVVRFFGTPVMQELIASFQPDQQFTAEQISSLSMPILMFWGRSDRLLSRSAFEFYRDHLPPHAVVEELEAAGHSPHIERPDEIAGRILAFARAHSPDLAGAPV